MRKMNFWLAVLVVLSLGLCAFGAPVTINTLYNTGIGANPGDPDPHWSITALTPGNAYEVTGSSAGTFPFTYWLANDGTSQWIAPNSTYSTTLNDALGTWVFRTTFDLTGLIPGTASITGNWLADNKGTNIYINGAATGQVTPWNVFRPTGSWSSFTISSGFISGINTLDFYVLNQNSPTDANNPGGPVGLRVAFTSATANLDPVPEPATFALLGAGLVALGLVRRRMTNV
jgi:hypothetical protein